MSERLTLRDGPTVDAEAIRLALLLESRGCVFAIDGDSLVLRGGHWTDSEANEIRARKADLMQIVAYAAPEVP
jgi:hypothetical protein